MMAELLPNKWYRTTDRSNPIPQNEILRVWVQTLWGAELELHAQYLGEEGWDLPTGLKINILTVEAFQKIAKPEWKLTPSLPPPPTSPITIELTPPSIEKIQEPPHTPSEKTQQPTLAESQNHSKIKSKNPEQPSAIMTYSPHQEQPKAELQVFVTYPELKIECTLSNKYKILMYQERGEIPNNEDGIIIINSDEIKKMRPEARGALLWIWAEMGDNVIRIGEQDRKITIEEAEDIIISIGKKIKDEIERDIKTIYQTINSWPNEIPREHLFEYVKQILAFTTIAKKYGNSTIRELCHAKLERIDEEYRKLREEWISQWGSEELKYFAMTNHPEIEFMYAQERLKIDFPMFQLVQPEQTGKIIKKERPSIEEIKVAMNFPNAIIATQTKMGNNANEFSMKTYIVINSYLGQYQIMIPIEKAIEYINSRMQEAEESEELAKKESEERPSPTKGAVPAHLNGKGTLLDEVPEKPLIHEAATPQEPIKPKLLEALENNSEEETTRQESNYEPPRQPRIRPEGRRTSFLNNLSKGVGKPPPKEPLN